MRKYLRIRNIYFPYDQEKGGISAKKIFSRTREHISFKHKGKIHKGYVLTKYKKYKILDCKLCKLIHCVPIPSNNDLNFFYKKKFYQQERKKNYFAIQNKQINWWNRIFLERLKKFEDILGKTGNVLDIGCGPGFFLRFAKKRGWKVSGIDSSLKAVNYAKKKLKLRNITVNDYTELNSTKKNSYDVIYSNGVLEHIDDPLNFIKISHRLLKKKGLLFLSVANDFNFFQFLSMKKILRPWWILPPEHINYFRINDIKKIFNKKYFKIKNLTTSFPIEIFLLMGQNYIRNNKVGKLSHSQRVAFEDIFEKLGMLNFKNRLYKKFSDIGVGRAIEIIVQKK